MVAQRTSHQNKFDKLLIEAIDQALSSFGESLKTETYNRLEKEFNLDKQEIPNRLNDLSKALETLFGLDAFHLEIMFMKSLYAKVSGFEGFSCEMTISNLTFRDYVRLMRQHFEETRHAEVEIGILTTTNLLV